MRYEISEDKFVEGRWVVRATSLAKEEDNIYVTLFDGHNAENRAREYATWKNVFAGGSRGGINGGAFKQ